MSRMKRKDIVICSLLFLIFIFSFLIVLFDNNLVIDKAIYNFIMRSRCPFLDTYFSFITKLGNPLGVVLVVSLFMFILKKRDRIFLAVSAISSLLVNTGIKYIIRRERPEHLRLIFEDGYSFPSGHAMISICVYGVILYLVITGIKNKYLRYTLAILIGIIIISIGLSRIYVGVHYPTDVLAGYVLASIIVIVLIRLKDIWGE